MRHVAEEGREHRIEGLRDQPLHVAESLNDAGGPLIIDVDDDRERQEWFVGVFGHQVDRVQTFVVAMRFGAAGDPVQDEVGGRHEDDRAGERIERIFARAQRPFPNAALAFGHAFAVAEGSAGKVFARLTEVANDDADIADRDDGFGNQLDRGEPAVDEVGAVGQRHVLASAAAAAGEEGFGILVVVVVMFAGGIGADGRGDDFARRQRRAIVNGDDADAVGFEGLVGIQGIDGGDRSTNDNGIKTTAFGKFFAPLIGGFGFLAVEQLPQCVDARLGDDDEHRQVDGVDTFAEDRALAAALAEGRVGSIAAQKAAGILKVVAGNDSAQAFGSRGAADHRGHRHNRFCLARR